MKTTRGQEAEARISYAVPQMETDTDVGRRPRSITIPPGYLLCLAPVEQTAEAVVILTMGVAIVVVALTLRVVMLHMLAGGVL